MTIDRRADPLLMQQEHVPVLAHRPAALKLAGDRLPDLARERQKRAVAGLPRADLHRSRPPINVWNALSFTETVFFVFRVV